MQYLSGIQPSRINTKKLYTILISFLFLLIIQNFQTHRLYLDAQKIFRPDNNKENFFDGDSTNEENASNRLQYFATSLKKYATANHYNTSVCFLVDMSIPSGKNRLFVYDFNKEAVITSALVAHGSCGETFLADARFSNTPDCGCSSIGKYKIGKPYIGKFGKAYKLYGLDESNSNAYKRVIVLHGYDYVPDEETYPLPICNSLGCPMVAHKFLEVLAKQIDASPKPILLWIFK